MNVNIKNDYTCAKEEFEKLDTKMRLIFCKNSLEEIKNNYHKYLNDSSIDIQSYAFVYKNYIELKNE